MRPMRKLIYITTSLLLISTTTTSAKNHVYLIHGYGAVKLSMSSLARHLKKNGYTVTNWGYNSLGKSIPELGKMLFDEIKGKKGIDSLNFVTHSMGGLVVRSLLGHAKQDSAFPRICRIVMLSPPNKGAEIADFFAQSKVIKKILGPNLEYMTTDSTSLANKLPVPEDEEVGIIAGARFDDKGYNLIIEGDDDGFLTTDKTRLGTEKDFIVIPEAHFFMAHNKKSKEYVLRFLKTGKFIEK